MIIQMPSRSREIATVADLLVAIERPWRDDMHVRAIARHIEWMRFAARTISELLDESPTTISSDWLLSLTKASLKDMSMGVAAPYRQGFMSASLQLIQHAQIYRDNDPQSSQPFTAGLENQ